MAEIGALGPRRWIDVAILSRIVIYGVGLFLLTVLYKTTREWREAIRQGRRSQAEEAFDPGAKGGVIESLHDFNWETTEPTQYWPIKPIYHITMAVQQDTPSRLITIDKDYLDRVMHRRELIRQKGSGVHGSLPQGRESVFEVYNYLLRDYLPVRYPTMFKLSADGTVFRNAVTGVSLAVEPPKDAAAALRALGETVEEDMFFLHETSDGHFCVAFLGCFPAGFNPATKLGKLLKDIHAPVPSYSKIGPSMERFFSKLQVGKSAKRLNWSLQTHNELYGSENHIYEDEAGVQPDEEIDVDATNLRVELQTVTRLPKTRAILFSFKTYLYGIRQIKEAGSGPELADAIEGLKLGNAPGMWRYKAAVRWAQPVCEYLRS